jgi:hypothetical protein
VILEPGGDFASADGSKNELAGASPEGGRNGPPENRTRLAPPSVDLF